MQRFRFLSGRSSGGKGPSKRGMRMSQNQNRPRTRLFGPRPIVGDRGATTSLRSLHPRPFATARFHRCERCGCDSSESGSPPHLTPTDLEEGVREGSSPEYRADLTDPQAAEELPHSDLDREQALELMQSVFDPLLEAPAGVFDELHVERFLSDTAAILPAGEQLESPGAVIGAPPAPSWRRPWRRQMSHTGRSSPSWWSSGRSVEHRGAPEMPKAIRRSRSSI